MCEKGGRRCENADELTKYKRKISRTNEYRNSSVYNQERIMSAAVVKWKNQNKKLVQSHAPKRAYFNTRAKPKDVSSVSAALDEHGVFAAPDESGYSISSLIEENREVRERMKEKYKEVKSYSFVKYLSINSHLRNQTDSEDFPESKSNERIEKAIADIDACIEQATELNSGKQHSLYREIRVPAGWTAKQYAKKYFGVGEVVSDPGFISTSHSPSHILSRVNGSIKKKEASLVFAIHTRDGISLQDTEPTSSTVQSQEMERLLPRDHRMVVVGMTTQTYANDDNVTVERAYSYVPQKEERAVTTVHCVSEELFKEWKSQG